MNITMVDTMGYDMQIGERIEVVSQDRFAPHSVESIARTIGTIPYEVLVKFPQSLHREVID